MVLIVYSLLTSILAFMEAICIENQKGKMIGEDLDSSFKVHYFFFWISIESSLNLGRKLCFAGLGNPFTPCCIKI